MVCRLWRLCRFVRFAAVRAVCGGLCRFAAVCAGLRRRVRPLGDRRPAVAFRRGVFGVELGREATGSPQALIIAEVLCRQIRRRRRRAARSRPWAEGCNFASRRSARASPSARLRACTSVGIDLARGRRARSRSSSRGIWRRVRSCSDRQPAAAPLAEGCSLSSQTRPLGCGTAFQQCASALLWAGPELESVRQDRAGRSLGAAEARNSLTVVRGLRRLRPESTSCNSV